MRSVLTWFTVRGASFLAAGIVGILAGLTLGSDAMVSVGVLLICLPVFSALTARRARYQLRCERRIDPPRVTPGQPATVTIRLENVSRISTGLLLAEETIPYSLGARPRYVLNGIERGGAREVSYPLRSDLRGKFVVGPMRVRIADVFGLVELTANFATRNTLTVTPKVTALTSAATTGSWSTDGDGRTRMTSAAGDDDVIPRAYRDGDELRRVHWRSTARYGELMVRREEQRWRNRALLLLDTRRYAHAGSGITSSFEYAVGAAASVGVHLARSGMDGQLITDAGPVPAVGMFEDVLLDSLAVIKPSRGTELSGGLAAVRAAGGGLLVVIAGRLSATAARQLATSRRDSGPAIALLLAVSTWGAQRARENEPANGRGPAAGNGSGRPAPDPGQPANGQAAAEAAPASRPKPDGRPDAHAETSAAAAILSGAGWRVVTVDAGMPLGTAWRGLARAGMTGAGMTARPAARSDLPGAAV